MSEKEIGLWMYHNGGGYEIEKKIVSMLNARDIHVLPGINLKDAHAYQDGIFYHGKNLLDLDLFLSYNAGEQTTYQLYLLEQLSFFVPTINNYSAFILSEDKFKTNQRLKMADIRTPDFLLCHAEDQPRVRKQFEVWDHRCVYKPLDGWGGTNLVLINSKTVLDALFPFLNQLDVHEFYLEQFINYDGSDFRIDIVDGEYISCYGRQAKEGDWRTNITSGGEIILREPEDKIVEVAKEATRVTGLEIAGVDIIYDRDKEEYVVLEVNGIPAFATPEQEAFGLNFNEKKVQKIVDLIEKKVSA